MSGHSRFVRKDLNDRQLKSIKTMYEDETYSMADIRARFSISDSTIHEVTKNLGCAPRKTKDVKKDPAS